jgi:hypothetical protein
MTSNKITWSGSLVLYLPAGQVREGEELHFPTDVVKHETKRKKPGFGILKARLEESSLLLLPEKVVID